MLMYVAILQIYVVLLAGRLGSDFVKIVVFVAKLILIDHHPRNLLVRFSAIFYPHYFTARAHLNFRNLSF
jgi:hypothetical protein